MKLDIILKLTYNYFHHQKIKFVVPNPKGSEFDFFRISSITSRS